MFPDSLRMQTLAQRFPRIRGDVPTVYCLSHGGKMFSPHTRGCSMQARGLCPGFFVFPAYAGMFPLQLPHRTHLDCFPRIRGDVPADQVADQLQSGFSPHTRGCSPFCWGKITFPFVFPAYAGMFRKPHSFPWLLDGFPRIRGDVPSRWSERHRKETFSPHTRGCSGKPLMKFFELTVFPAYAGMFPRRGGGIPPMAGFPRIRGDVPLR